MPKKVYVFTTSTCPSCHEEKAWLSERGIAFAELNLEDAEAIEELRELERRVKRRFNYVPITVINGEVYEGFDPETLAGVLAE